MRIGVVAAFFALALIGCGGTGINFIDNFAHVVVEPVGKSFSALGDQIKIDVKPNTFSKEVTFLIAKAVGLPILPFLIAASAYNVQVQGGIAQNKVDISVAYSLADLPSGSQESSLRLFRIVEGKAAEVPGSTVSPSQKIVSASVDDPNGVFVVGVG